eukprot:4769246-Pleurochrysis_carterae.AAC.1
MVTIKSHPRNPRCESPRQPLKLSRALPHTIRAPRPKHIEVDEPFWRAHRPESALARQLDRDVVEVDKELRERDGRARRLARALECDRVAARRANVVPVVRVCAAHLRAVAHRDVLPPARAQQLKRSAHTRRS